MIPLSQRLDAQPEDGGVKKEHLMEAASELELQAALIRSLIKEDHPMEMIIPEITEAGKQLQFLQSGFRVLFLTEFVNLPG